MRQTRGGKEQIDLKHVPRKKAVEDTPRIFPQHFLSAFTYSSTEHVFLHKASHTRRKFCDDKTGIRQTQVGKRANRSETCPAKKAVEDRPPGYFPNAFCSAFTYSSSEHVFLFTKSPYAPKVLRQNRDETDASGKEQIDLKHVPRKTPSGTGPQDIFPNVSVAHSRPRVQEHVFLCKESIRARKFCGEVRTLKALCIHLFAHVVFETNRKTLFLED
ncbi:hypothetical protein CEXT_11191 [Caerostris extrusa]|uniref:Uncharacterized protein n=1 Tax=Caerostris extrusa TaxID=172846 RepID=A0AAV4XI95_CAEEX|nr:hypothetical protein CEXT_11191 [Caerostris extrusa]